MKLGTLLLCFIGDPSIFKSNKCFFLSQHHANNQKRAAHVTVTTNVGPSTNRMTHANHSGLVAAKATRITSSPNRPVNTNARIHRNKKVSVTRGQGFIGCGIFVVRG